MGQLQNVISLILNNNDLNGEIPNQLSNCFSLTNLIISYNNISGMVPPSKTFSRFSPDSFFGNPMLCGNWLGSICDHYSPKQRGTSYFIIKSKLIWVKLSGLTINLEWNRWLLVQLVEAKGQMKF